MSTHSDFDLRTYVDTEWLDRFVAFLPDALKWWRDRTKEPTAYGVDSSTVRAMSTGSGGKLRAFGPLAVYEEWAECELIALGLKGTPSVAANATANWTSLRLHTTEGFDVWHQGLAQRLQAHWSTKLREIDKEVQQRGLKPGRVVSEGVGLRLAHKYKLVDLFVRFLRVFATTDSELGKAIVENAHIPLDMKSISVINATMGLPVLANQSMGNIQSELAYRNYQRLARAICEAANERTQEHHDTVNERTSPILLDVFAWQNPEAQSLYEKANSKQRLC